MKDIIRVNTGVVFLKIKEDKELTIDDVTTLQVINSGFVNVFVNDFEIASGEKITLVAPDGTLSKVELNIRFASIDNSSVVDTNPTMDLTYSMGGNDFSIFTWNRKEIDIIYKKFITCSN
ncbi:hypothetical protein [Flavobacterium poyangense]|uniref:hypothetical protein n=1 Tax=Flavobacterium poyangense TaxID=2204302 RepID=UPI00142391D4|nr:hypothetical protein [Flavobacterium sp. JXAS1]